MEYQKVKKIKTNKNSIFIMLGLLIIFTGCSMFIYNSYSNKKIKEEENKSIERFFSDQKKQETEKIEKVEENRQSIIIDYKAVLEIPKINLKKGITDKNNSQNNVNRNIYVLKETIFPNEKSNSHIFLAAHSGNSSVSYFKNLNKLVLDDEVYFFYEKVKYIYKIVNKYEIEKTGTMKLNLTDESDITLVTCISGTNKQIVFVGKLINKENF